MENREQQILSEIKTMMATIRMQIEKLDAKMAQLQQIVDPEDVAALALFLCSEAAGFITGENICVDGGMTKLMIYHGDHGCSIHDSQKHVPLTQNCPVVCRAVFSYKLSLKEN